MHICDILLQSSRQRKVLLYNCIINTNYFSQMVVIGSRKSFHILVNFNTCGLSDDQQGATLLLAK